MKRNKHKLISKSISLNNNSMASAPSVQPLRNKSITARKRKKTAMKVKAAIPNIVEKTMNYAKQEAWTLIHSYFNQSTENPLLSHQINSFNDFIRYGINSIIKQTNPVKV